MCSLKYRDEGSASVGERDRPATHNGSDLGNLCRMLGFDLDFWDYATFITAALAGLSVVVFMVWLAGLPGRIARARKHPDAEAVNLLGWAGLLPTIYPWVQAFIWAFKPTEVVDIRRFPREESLAIDEEMDRLSGKAPPSPSPTKAGRTKPTHDGASLARPGPATSDKTTR